MMNNMNHMMVSKIQTQKGSEPTDIIMTCFNIGCTLKKVSEIFVDLSKKQYKLYELKYKLYIII